MAVRWPTMSASMRRPGAGKAEIHEAEPTLARSRGERLTFALMLSVVALPTCCARRPGEVQAPIRIFGRRRMRSGSNYGAQTAVMLLPLQARTQPTTSTSCPGNWVDITDLILIVIGADSAHDVWSRVCDPRAIGSPRNVGCLTTLCACVAALTEFPIRPEDAVFRAMTARGKA